MFARVVWPLIETAATLTGRIVRPALNVLCDWLEWCAKWTR